MIVPYDFLFHILFNNTTKSPIIATKILYQLHPNDLKKKQAKHSMKRIKSIEILQFTNENYSKRSSNSVVIALHPFPTYMNPDVT